MSAPVYKICRREAWLSAAACGSYAGSPDDRRDGFIHLSTAAQVAATAAKHFAGQTGLVLLTVDPARLGAGLAWEPSRGGDLFPHFHGAMPADAVTAVDDLPLGPDGHVFPDPMP